MKSYKKLLTVFMILLLFCFCCFPAFALDDEDDPWEDETEPWIVTTTQPDTTVPQGSLPTKRETMTTTTSKEAETPAPLVRITRQNLSGKPSENESFAVTVLFHNYSNLSLLQGIAVFEPGDGLVLAEKSDSKVVPVVDPNGIAKVVIHLRAEKEYEKTEIPVAVSYAYSYRTPDGIVAAETSDKLIIPMQTPVKAAEQSDTANATPNIIVTKYQYGGTIAAGDAFTLYLEFTNTSRKLAAENIVMAVETGESVSITGASNTYYYALLGAGQTTSQSIPMRVSVSGGTQGAKIDISFRYEFVDHGSRGNTTTSESLSVPIYVPDRFHVTAPDTELIGTQNEELAVSIPYVNKGKSDVSNVQAKLIYDEKIAYCEQPQINLGNFEPGKSGTIDFYFTPTEAGSGSVQVVVTYEDERLQEKTLTVRVPYVVDEMFIEPDYGMEDLPDDTQPQSPVKTILKIAVPIVLIIGLIVLIAIIKKRRKKKADPSAAFDWSFVKPEEPTDENR